MCIRDRAQRATVVQQRRHRGGALVRDHRIVHKEQLEPYAAAQRIAERAHARIAQRVRAHVDVPQASIVADRLCESERMRWAESEVAVEAQLGRAQVDARPDDGLQLGRRQHAPERRLGRPYGCHTIRRGGRRLAMRHSDLHAQRTVGKLP
eukprot:6074090-Prymnesium_polylepis.1